MKRNKFEEIRQIREIYLQISIPYLILPAHIILTLFYIYHHESAGKYSISEFLSTIDSRVRMLLDILENNGLISKNPGRKGSQLTETGNKLIEGLRKYFKILSLFNPDDLGTSVLGTINSVTAIPLSYISQPINVIQLRDTSLKYGAIGATVFKAFLNEKKELEVYFIDDNSHSTQILFPENEIIEHFLVGTTNLQVEWLIIASTVGNLPDYYYSPLFDTKKITPFTIVLFASVQTLWELLFREL